MQNKYNVLFDNTTGRIIIKKPNKPITNTNTNTNTNTYKNNESRMDEQLAELQKLIEKNSKESTINNKPQNIGPLNIKLSNDSLNNQKYPYPYESTINNKSENIDPLNIKLSNDSLNNQKYPYPYEQTINNKSENIGPLNIKLSNDSLNNQYHSNNVYEQTINNKHENISLFNNKHHNLNTIKYKTEKKNVVYGIKKTILSDFNYLYNSSNSNDFRISLNRSKSNINNRDESNAVFDAFYLFPNISEINTKSETNIINEKKVIVAYNRYDPSDKQLFPIDFTPSGINVPIKTENTKYTKIIIDNIYWNIFQSIEQSNYNNNEILGIVPFNNDFNHKDIYLKINIELHSQLSGNIEEYKKNKLLPYYNEEYKINSSNTCLNTVHSFNINTLNGSNFDPINIEINDNLNINCALLCIKISIPDEIVGLLKGVDKYNNTFYGYIPFSQFILNFDYHLI